MNRKSSSPRILYLSTPWPYKSIRALHIARALGEIGSVEVVVVDSECAKWKSVESLGAEFKVLYELEVQQRSTNQLSETLMRALAPRFPYPHGLGVNDDGNSRILQSIEDYDLIWFYKYRTANMFCHWNWPRSVLDIDDLPSGVYGTVSKADVSLKERLLARFQTLVWKRREKLLGDRFSVLAVCSEADKQSLRLKAPIHVIPNGFERPTGERLRNPATPPRIGFIGLFDYIANIQGVRWFITKCWPRIKRDIPDARLRLVGRGSDSIFKDLGPDIDGLGWVEDANDEISSWSVMIVPLHIGGGQRVKIAEGFSRKCPVISTRVGAFGYEIQSGRELLLADDPGEFAAGCVSLIRDPALGSVMAERAFAAFLEKWTWDAIAPRVQVAAEDALRRAGRFKERESRPAQTVPAAGQARGGEQVSRGRSRAIKFSVIIPTYNRARFVQLAIQSALKQRCDGLEVIVVDDGSEDETASILKNSNLDIKYVYQRNQGVSSARNRGLKEAAGEWVAFLDSDDEWHPDYLFRQQGLTEKYPLAVALVLDGEERGDSDNFIEAFHDNELLRKFGSNRDMLINAPFQDVVRHHVTTLGSCVFRRETLMKTRLFDEALSIGEDHDIILQMALKGPFAFCRDVGAFRYRRKESIMNLSAQLYKSGLKARLCWALVFERFLQSSQLLESERKAVCFKYSRNQRALGNLYLRVGDKAKARDAYKQAWRLRPSIESAARLAFAYLPFKIGKFFLHKEGNVSPGFVRIL